MGKHLRCVGDDFGMGLHDAHVIEFHDLYVCPTGCNDCPYCKGGLQFCLKCGCGEKELLEYCPGIFLDHDSAIEIEQGKIVDIGIWRKKREHKESKEV